MLKNNMKPVKINLKTSSDVAKEANKIKYQGKKEHKNGVLYILSERIKAVFLWLKV